MTRINEYIIAYWDDMDIEAIHQRVMAWKENLTSGDKTLIEDHRDKKEVNALAEIAAMAQPLGPANLSRQFDTYTERVLST